MADRELLECGDVIIDVAARRVVIGDEPGDLGDRAFDALVCLARRPGQVVSVDTLAAVVAADSGPDLPNPDDLVRVVIVRLRQALGTGPRRPVLLFERGGYRLQPPVT